MGEEEEDMETSKVTDLLQSLSVSKPTPGSGSGYQKVEKDIPNNNFDNKDIWGFDPFSQKEGNNEQSTASGPKENDDMSWATFGSDFQQVSGLSNNDNSNMDSTENIKFPSVPFEDKTNDD